MSLLLPLALLVALLVDRLREPPSWMHPVVGMGRYLGWFKLTRLPAPLAFVAGALAWLLGAALVAFIALWLEGQVLLRLEPWLSPWRLAAAAVLIGLLLKPLLAWSMLADEAMAVETALRESLDAGRARLSRLVSRDTSQLSATEVREAAIETLAENLNDSVIAPLFWFAIAGLPGAAIYRFANTADAMWGYRDEREWSGKWAARADDALSWIPARLTALLITWPTLRLWHEARRTPSPNSGWPMAAMALRLGLRLGKPGVYVLHADGRQPSPDDLHAARAVARHAVVAGGALLALLAYMLRT
ncbi:adenosylcobinamide-phosphate synthase CbiB [Roseateles asaccharophilus]|uniref:Cobalamin biosynthesis protein CobD n=1 Tax=Roseateles asaccharophilus TaxID=582607 RepID=A0ABU2A907_9BURK|nr:adenosylcobinamide-phosphate synthase CbiB [Roseateles asaccharophilus]MDR7333690.1 adenosylcobinamide-phosphate synthase [Roseateles asaccharophilus]